MPPRPVSGAPCLSHDAADTVGIHSAHRSTFMKTSYIAGGFAPDACSTRIVAAMT
jgi:hypothetical protein